MDRLRELIREAHRRSLWQVLSVYLVGSWGALQVVEVVTENSGLPDWVFPFALILLVIGLPVVLATALVQEGVSGLEQTDSADRPPALPDGKAPLTRRSSAPAGGEVNLAGSSPTSLDGGAPSGEEAFPPGGGGATDPTPGIRQRLFTWRNAMVGGVTAFGTLGLAVAGYFMMWSQGIGPIGSLAARGFLSDGDQVVLADFQNATPDSALGSVVTEALRIDLARSGVLTLAEPASVQQVLARMQRDPNQPLTPALAREVAEREGMKAVLEGEVGAAGSGYILSATIRTAESGETLASFRRTAEGPDQVVRAIDRLSEDIRGKAGESLRAIRKTPRLGAVTTGSLDALKRFTEAVERFDDGDSSGALALLEEAIAMDSTFAMAHRKLAVTLLNMSIDRHRQVEALEAAFRHRHRLTERERLITEATYHHVITGDRDAIVRAYDGVLRVNPDDATALNNLANAYMAQEEFERAGALYHRAVSGPGTSNTAHANLVRALLLEGDMIGARAALSAFAAEHPDDPLLTERGYWVHAWAGDWEGAGSYLTPWEERRDLPFLYRADASLYRARLAAARGQMVEARRLVAHARRLARAELGPAQEWFYHIQEVHLELATGRTDRARSALSALEDRRLFDEIPQAARNYGTALAYHNRVGNEPEVRGYIRRWREEVPPEMAGRYDETQRELFESMLGRPAARPNETLAAIELFRERLLCQRCFMIEEAEALEAAGRLREAQEAWRRAAVDLQTTFWFSLLDRAPAWERVGMLSDELGDVSSALEAYGHFSDLWRDADPELQPRVARARERMAALSASAPDGG
ncbi:MAG: tetratricopeptide repeat protein [Gemmatimonadota bacterium]